MYQIHFWLGSCQADVCRKCSPEVGLASLSQQRNIWNIDQRNGTLWRLGYKKNALIRRCKNQAEPFFLDLNIYFVAEIKILQLYYKFTTFINGKTTLFIFYINDSYDRHRLDFECQCNISQLTPSSSIAEKQQNFL